MSSSSSWQDRRFMFPAGRQIHEGSSSYVPPPAGAAQSPPVSIPSTTTSTSGASGSPPSSGKILPSWEGDRRFMFPTAKELHQPGRRLSGSSGSDKSTASAAAKATAPVASAASSAASAVTNPIANAIAGRRRVSTDLCPRQLDGHRHFSRLHHCIDHKLT